MIIDAHHHFWDLSNTPGIDMSGAPAVLQQSYMPRDLRPQLDTCGIDYTVWVQGYPQTNAVNRWYFDVADATPWILGVVAWVDLLNPKSCADKLDWLIQQPKFVGIRHIIEEEPDPNWIARPEVIESLKILSQHGVRFDVLVKAPQMPAALSALSQVPELHTVLDHIGKPAVRDDAWEPWAERLASLADRSVLPNLNCKLSGLITEANPDQCDAKHFQKYIDFVFDKFGTDRMMFGSDWPVCRIAGEYEEVHVLAMNLCESLSESQHEDVFARNAIRFYNLTLPETHS